MFISFQELGIPAYFGGMARGLLGKESPIQMRQNRKDAMRDADLIILAGDFFPQKIQ